jgi:hypothetical protein
MFWRDVLHPALQLVWAFIQGSIIPLFNAVSSLINSVFTVAVKALALVWRDLLQPALETVWKVIKDGLNPVIEALSKFMKDKLKPATKDAKDVMDKFRDGLDKLKKPIDWLIDKLTWLKDKFDAIKLPEGLKPGSPTPFEMGLRGINDALKTTNSEMGLLDKNMGIGSNLSYTGNGMGNGSSSQVNSNQNQTFNLTINSSANQQGIIQDYKLMKARMAVV